MPKSGSWNSSFSVRIKLFFMAWGRILNFFLYSSQEPKNALFWAVSLQVKRLKQVLLSMALSMQCIFISSLFKKKLPGVATSGIPSFLAVMHRGCC